MSTPEPVPEAPVEPQVSVKSEKEIEKAQKHTWPLTGFSEPFIWSLGDMWPTNSKSIVQRVMATRTIIPLYTPLCATQRMIIWYLRHLRTRRMKPDEVEWVADYINQQYQNLKELQDYVTDGRVFNDNKELHLLLDAARNAYMQGRMRAAAFSAVDVSDPLRVHSQLKNQLGPHTTVKAQAALLRRMQLEEERRGRQAEKNELRAAKNDYYEQHRWRQVMKRRDDYALQKYRVANNVMWPQEESTGWSHSTAGYYKSY
eukprot:GFYU01006841.1.p1 GENE.GFYU01006841.1~~GFYU01006841.1.p1  ORF type:complete len:274 (-),score=97.75 GFYU01006841.1:61-834(-)